MDLKKLVVASILLWVLLVGAGIFLFVRGSVRKADDGRQAIQLLPAERDLVLFEMRGILTSVKGIVDGVNSGDMKQVAAAARASGMQAAQDVQPSLMAKLPMDFKKRGMHLHGEFDALADMAEKGADSKQVLSRLNDQLSQCVACHSAYRLDPVSK